MPSSRLHKALPSLICHQCGDTHLAQTMVVQGDLGFCQRCAYERAMESLAKPKKRTWLIPSVCALGLALAGSLGWWGCNNLPDFWRSFVSNSSIAAAPAQAIHSVVSMPPTPIPNE